MALAVWVVRAGGPAFLRGGGEQKARVGTAWVHDHLAFDLFRKSSVISGIVSCLVDARTKEGLNVTVVITSPHRAYVAA